MKVSGSGVEDVQIMCRRERENDQADALSCNPVPSCKDHLEVGVQVAQVTSVEETDILYLLQDAPAESVVASDFLLEQRKDPELQTLLAYLEHGDLPAEGKEAQRVVSQALHFAVVDGVLHFVDQKAGNRKRVVVPAHM